MKFTLKIWDEEATSLTDYEDEGEFKGDLRVNNCEIFEILKALKIAAAASNDYNDLRDFVNLAEKIKKVVNDEITFKSKDDADGF